jgi:hypothetical protein
LILTIVDGNGAAQLVAFVTPGTAADASGTIAANLPLGGPLTYQQLLPAVAAGATARGGWYIRNRGAHAMTVTEDGTDPSVSKTAATIATGEVFPPPGVPYPITQGAVNVAGTPADPFTCKTW